MSYKIDSSIRARYYGSSNRGNPKYIVLHYTGNSGTSATAKGNANYFHTCDRKASAHYVVDKNTTIYQCVPDNRAAWSVGDSSNGHGTFYGKCTNTNSLSIEMVSHSNGSYYIPDATIQRAAELTRDLMKKYGINADHVIRHYDVTTKACPEPMCGTTAKNKKWAAFKALLTATVIDVNKTVKVVSDDGSLNIRFGPGTSHSVIGSLKTGQTAEVVGVSGNWYKIKYGSGYGYISSAYTADVTITIDDTSNQEDDEMIEATKHKINGKTRNINAITKDGVTYTCLKDLCAALGLNLTWDSATGERVITLPDVEVKVNGQTITVPGAFINADTHLTAASALLKSMGYAVGCTSAYHITADTAVDVEIAGEEVFEKNYGK
ncbi:MAG: N-acetylmuramoyl-L-alanine amidase [Eubacteriales bacterium]|nr:N-acetylmuramoyl-L-alanine amidase [Eubacteriales bacterium]